jgi:hypothetical protein
MPIRRKVMESEYITAEGPSCDIRKPWLGKAGYFSPPGHTYEAPHMPVEFDRDGRNPARAPKVNREETVHAG